MKISLFLQCVTRLLDKIFYPAMINGLSQTLLRIACPGVPDFYQGCELWDYHLVDPDNRGAVDFASRTEALQQIIDRDRTGPCALAADLLAHWPDGRIKLYLIWKALGLRRQNPQLFSEGEFLPLRCTGPRSQHIVSFMRRSGNDQALVVLPRWLAKLPAVTPAVTTEAASAVANSRLEFWKDTNLHLPTGAAPIWRNIFATRSAHRSSGQSLPVADLFKDFPVAMLIPAGESSA